MFEKSNQNLQLFEKQKLELQVRSEPIKIQVFQTSIWDETLYAVCKHLDIVHVCIVPHH